MIQITAASRSKVLRSSRHYLHSAKPKTWNYQQRGGERCRKSRPLTSFLQRKKKKKKAVVSRTNFRTVSTATLVTSLRDERESIIMGVPVHVHFILS